MKVESLGPADEPVPDLNGRALRLSGFSLDLAAGELLTPGGALAPLRRQALDVLLVLGRRVGQVVSRDDLMRGVWPDVVVGDGSLTQAIVDIRRVIGDGEHRIVRNVARRGYMLVPDASSAAAPPAELPPMAPVAEPSASPASPETPAPPDTPDTPAQGPDGASTRATWQWAGIGAAVLLAAGAAWWLSQGRTSAPAGPAASSAQPADRKAPLGRDVPALSLVVLPLTVEGDPQDGEWFADALLGDLTTEVARLPGSFVIARDTAQTYKGRNPDPREVARELGVRYVVSGSLRREGASIRLNFAMVDGVNGGQLWAEKFVFERSRLAQALDEFVFQLARVLSLELARSAGDRSAAMSAEEVSADDLAMRALALWIRGVNRENVTQALGLLEQAVARNPDSIRGWAYLSFMRFQAGANGWVGDRAATVRRTDEAAANLVRLDPDGALTYQAKVIQAYLRSDWPAALRLTSAWVERHPNYPIALGGHGITLVVNGRFEEGIAPIERALRLSPRDSFRAEWYYRLSLTNFYLRRYEEAVRLGMQAQETNPTLPWPPVHAAALAQLGRTGEARQVFDDVMRRHPNFKAADLERRVNGVHPRVVEGRERLLASLRSLGLP